MVNFSNFLFGAFDFVNRPSKLPPFAASVPFSFFSQFLLGVCEVLVVASHEDGFPDQMFSN